MNQFSLNFVGLQNFTRTSAPEGEFIWSTHITSSLYQDAIAVFIHSKLPEYSKEMVQRIQKVVLKVDQYLAEAILAIKNALTETPEKYKLSVQEKQSLTVGVEEFPVDQPSLNFYDHDDEWFIHFASGRFDCCYPHGIGVLVYRNQVIEVENLSDSKGIE